VSDEKYTRVQTEAYEALIRVPIRELVEQLDPALFLADSPLHDRERAGDGRRGARPAGPPAGDLQKPPEKLEVSRSFTHLFRQM